MTTNQTGTVKWFNEGKGYGFITPDGGGKDLFAHFREIQGETGYKTLAENARVQFDVRLRTSATFPDRAWRKRNSSSCAAASRKCCPIRVSA